MKHQDLQTSFVWHPAIADSALQVPFVPKRWQPKDPSIPQIPYTFPPKAPAGKTKEGKTPGTGSAGQGGKRRRSLAPSAWNQGALHHAL